MPDEASRVAPGISAPLDAMLATLLTGLDWHAADDGFVRNLRLYWLGPYRESATVSQHGIMVFAERKKDRRLDKVRTHYTARVACGLYGETVCETELPAGTSLQQAKAEALRLANDMLAEGYTFDA